MNMPDSTHPDGESAARSEDDSTQSRQAFLRNGLLRPADVDALCELEHRSNSQVEGIVNARSVGGIFGDSGIGKSPLCYQLGLCVASGLPFVGLATKPGAVVYVDYENGLDEGRLLRDMLCRHLKLAAPPNDFIIWSAQIDQPLNFDEICTHARPTLVIIDSLRSFDPLAESKDRAPILMKNLRHIAHHYGTTILFVHHTRKPPNGETMPPLEDEILMHWLYQAAGHRSLINQSDCRIAAHIPSGPRHAISALKGGVAEEVALVLRCHRRIYGEVGPLFLARTFDEDGEPVGYRKLVSAELLFNPDQEAAFGKLPETFTTGDARREYRRGDQATSDFLRKCTRSGLIRKVRQGHWEKGGLTG
jgi:hypothetical protein